METRQVALIRGINVGSAKRVAMADLREMMGRLGFRDCRTLLNSGNVIYTAEGVSPSESATRIQQAMEADLGVAAPVTALSAADFQIVVSECSLKDVAENPSRLLVSFLLDPSIRSRLEPLVEEDWSPEALVLGTRASYAWCPAGVLDSKVLPAIERALGQAVTSRNWKTVTKIQNLL